MITDTFLYKNLVKSLTINSYFSGTFFDPIEQYDIS
jgi:hypothetical protein